MNTNVNAVEIVNESAIPIFQVYYRRPDVIALRGIISNSNTTMVVNEDFMAGDPAARPIDLLKLKPMFRYPSRVYPGVYVEYPFTGFAPLGPKPLFEWPTNAP